jgi:hypothetical protein
LDDLKGYVGICKLGYYRVPYIAIDRTYWKNSSRWGREWLVFHELGHCVLDRDHRDDKFGVNCPASIMHSYANSFCYKDYRNYYVKELFTIP